MAFREISCPKCGGPLPAEARKRVVECTYCGARVMHEVNVVHAASYRRDHALRERELHALADMQVGDAHYKLEGCVGVGESAEVFVASRQAPNAERVLLKVLRDPANAAWFRASFATLQTLQRSDATGVAHFARLLPEPIALEPLVRMPASLAFAPRTLVQVLRYRIGFSHSLAQLSAHLRQADPRHLVWVAKRTLEVLSWVHSAGYVHGALLPSNIVLNAKDHGAMLVGFGAACPKGTRESVRSAAYAALYPIEVGAPLTTHYDLQMLARTLLSVAPTSLPALIAGYLTQVADGANLGEAPSMLKQLASLARDAFGPPAFVPLVLP